MASTTASLQSASARPAKGIAAYATRLATRYARERLDALFAESGIRINGPMPWDPIVHDDRVLSRVVRSGLLGAGETYVDGDWDCAALDELAARIARLGLDQKVGSIWRGLSESLATKFSNRQRARAAVHNGRAHYDLGDDLYAAMLGSTMVYSCGYWLRAGDLDQAQRAKLELVCAKLELSRGQSLLDLGCGYGELARHAAAHHGVRVVGVTVSRGQARMARRRCAGLPVEIQELDYRSIHGRFDRIASIGMFEHVGPRNYHTFFSQVRRLLRPDGLFLLHTIGDWRDNQTSFDPWLDRYIFPGAVLPSAVKITAAIDGKLVIEDWQNLGADYDRTLLAWHANFEHAWPALEHYGERFHRMWRYYLLTCAGSFRARRNQVWQLVLSPDGHRGGYRRPLL